MTLESGRNQQALKENVIDSGLCTGCGACVGHCPYQEGWHDRIVTIHPCDLAEGRCYAYCPRTPLDMTALRQALSPGVEWLAECGPVRAFYVTQAADEEVRLRSQHGGTVTALLRLALEEGIIDEAVVTTADENLLPDGKEATDVAGLEKTGGSRFPVSPVLALFNRRARIAGGPIGVVTTPCQGLALARMRQKPLPDAGDPIDRLGLVIGLFCGWALDWRKLRDVLRGRLDLRCITGMDIPPSQYHRLDVYTTDGTVSVSLDEVIPCVRPSCLACTDMTSEWSDLSVGAARLPGGWEEARAWNQVIVRTERGEKLIALAKARGVLRFREVPAGAMEKLKKAAANKKRAGVATLAQKSGRPDDLIYLDPTDPLIAPFCSRQVETEV